MPMPTIYKTAPMLGTINQQPSIYETSLDQFLNAPNGYLGHDVDISYLINWCINNPTIDGGVEFDLYLYEAISIYNQLLLDLHNDSLIFDFGVALTNTQASIPIILKPRSMSKKQHRSSTRRTFNPNLPMGIVCNSTDGFVKSSVGNFGASNSDDKSAIIAADSRGVIYSYHPLSHSGSRYGIWSIIDDSEDFSVYTGLTIAGTNLYLADLANLHVRIYDYQWNKGRALDEHAFQDPDLPPNYSPFNICLINGSIYILYALLDITQPIGTCEIVSGPGLGLINIFTMDGVFIKRAATFGHLNAPWG